MIHCLTRVKFYSKGPICCGISLYIFFTQSKLNDKVYFRCKKTQIKEGGLWMRSLKRFEWIQLQRISSSFFAKNFGIFQNFFFVQPGLK